jgi:integrase
VTLPDGTRRSFYGKTEKEAREKKNRALRQAEAGLVPEAGLTVAAYLGRWLAARAEVVRAGTLVNERQHVELHIVPSIGRVRLSELTVARVNRLLADLVAGGMMATTANAVRATLRRALAQAHREGLVPRNVAALATPRRGQPRAIVVYTPAQARRLVAEARTHPHGPLVAVALATGLRRGELIGLRWADVDLDARTLRVERSVVHVRRRWVEGPPKSAAGRRTIRLTEVAVEALRRQRVLLAERRLAAGGAWVDRDLVFPNQRGGYLADAIRAARQVMTAAGVPVTTLHALRHSCASFLVAEGMDLVAVKELLGHSSIAVTADTYAHLTERLASRTADTMDRVLGDDEGLRSIK